MQKILGLFMIMGAIGLLPTVVGAPVSLLLGIGGLYLLFAPQTNYGEGMALGLVAGICLIGGILLVATGIGVIPGCFGLFLAIVFWDASKKHRS